MALPTSPIVNISLLRPVLTLASWTFAMEIWLYATRIPAFSKYKINLKNPSKAKAEMEAKFPPHVTNVSANFAHLHEQPTVFYAVVLALAVAGDTSLATVSFGFLSFIFFLNWGEGKRGEKAWVRMISETCLGRLSLLVLLDLMK
jgi:hypothetical protein